MSARKRIAAYLKRRELSRGLDLEHIHGFDVGPDCGVELLASDLRSVLAELKRAKKMLQSIEWPRDAGDSFDHIACPICSRIQGSGHEPDCALAAVLTEKE